MIEYTSGMSNANLKRTVIVLRGLFMSVMAPTAEKLSITLDVSQMSQNDVLELREKINNILNEIDERHIKRMKMRRGRAIKTLWKKERRRVVVNNEQTYVTVKKEILHFIPFPSSYLNSVTYIRTRLYDIVNRYTTIIQRFVEGNYRRYLYLLPFIHVNAFLNYVSKLNKELEEIQVQINEFTRSEYFNRIRDVLKEYGLEYVLDKEFEIKQIKITTMPIAIDPEYAKKMIDDFMDITFSANKPTEGYEEVYEQVENTTSEFVKVFLESIHEKIDNLVANIMAGKDETVTLNALEKTLRSSGLNTEELAKLRLLMGDKYRTNTAKEVFNAETANEIASKIKQSILRNT